MRFIMVARREKMGNHSRRRSMNSIHRTNASSDKKPLLVDLALRAPPSFIIQFGSYKQACQMSMAGDDY